MDLISAFLLIIIGYLICYFGILTKLSGGETYQNFPDYINFGNPLNDMKILNAQLGRYATNPWRPYVKKVAPVISPALGSEIINTVQANTLPPVATETFKEGIEHRPIRIKGSF